MFSLIFLFLSSFLYSLDNPFNENKIEIHIFIHGTADGMHIYWRTFGEGASFKGFLNNLKSKIIGNFDQKKNQQLYADEFSFALFKDRSNLVLNENFPSIMGIKPGLSEITHPKCSKKKCDSCISKKSYNSIFNLFKKNIEKTKKEKQSYYMFNWVGNLSSYDRKLASEKLSKELLTLQESYPNSKINLYGHSHGGNVILNALNILKKTNFKAHYIIFFGMPIGKKTEKIIDKTKYEKLYNFYSNEDGIQNKDFTFDIATMYYGRTIKKLNDNIYNIEVKRNDKFDLHHGMFFMSHNKGLGYPVICDIPSLLFFLDSNNNKNWRSEEYEYFIN